MLRSCYRSFWSLHDDKTILTPGRFYFADEDTPSAPFPTLLGSRNWDKDDYPAAKLREWGEWSGRQFWDAGAKPARLPAPRRVGSLDCLANGAKAGDVAPGNPLTGPFRTVCIGGVVYSFPANITVSFSVGYQNRDFTYYGDVPLSMVEADCEARWEGIGGPPNTRAIVRVTEGPGGTLRTNFYLSERISVVTPCCGELHVPGVLRMLDLYIEGRQFISPPDPPEWSMTVPSLTLTYSVLPPLPGMVIVEGGAWYAFVKCDGTQGTIGDFGYVVGFYCQGVGVFAGWILMAYAADGTEIFNRNEGGIVGIQTCNPFDFDFGIRDCTEYGAAICGNPITGHSLRARMHVVEPL